MNKFFPVIILTLVTLLATILRFTPIVWQRDFWYDEAFTGILLKASWGEMNQMIFADVHPPLYYWLVKPWSALFDYSPEGIRFFSLIFGVLTVVSIYWIGKRMFDTRAGLLAAAITAISPFAIEYSQEARMYSLFGFLFLWATWFFVKALDDDKKRDWILWGIFAGLAFLTHYLSLFFFIIYYVCYVLYRRKFQETKWKNAILGHGNFWLGVVVIAAFFASWLRYFIPHMMKGNLGWIPAAQLSDLPKTLQIFFFGHQPGSGGVPESIEFIKLYKDIPLSDGTSMGVLIFTIMTVMLSYIWLKAKKKKEVFVLAIVSLGTLLFLIVLGHLNLKLYVSRYFMPSALLVYLLLAGMTTLIFRSRWAWLVVLAIYAASIFLLVPIRFQGGWTEVSNFMKEQRAFDKSIIVADGPFSYTSARYYFGEENVRYYHRSDPMEDFSKWVVVGNKNRITDLAEIKEDPNMIIVDWTCDWGGELPMEELGDFQGMKICRVKR